MLKAEFAWTADDQARADAFERQILDLAATLREGHPDAIIVAFTQTLGSLMQQGLRADPSREGFYAELLKRLAIHVWEAVAPTDVRRRH